MGAIPKHTEALFARLITFDRGSCHASVTVVVEKRGNCKQKVNSAEKLARQFSSELCMASARRYILRDSSVQVKNEVAVAACN